MFSLERERGSARHDTEPFHATESIDPLWTMKGSGEMPYRVRDKTQRENADGVRKLGLCLDNGLQGPVLMSGYARIIIED